MNRALDSADLLDAALDAAARGWPVFPLHRGTKRPALHGYTRCPRQGACAGGHQGWEQRATTDPARIRAAWAAGPFNIGLATGPAGLLVVDCDTRKNLDDPDEAPPGEWAGAAGGVDVLAVLAEHAGAALPGTFTVGTPSGGRHLYFRAPAGAGLRNSAGLLGWKIDTRAHGGYVVAAGSTTPAGDYTVTDDRAPAELPPWLFQRLRPAPPPAPLAGPIRPGSGRRDRYLDAALRAETARVHAAAPAQRNACLYIASVALGQLVAGGSLSEPEARAVLLSAAARHLALRAYSPRQAEQTITSGLRAGAKRPRRIEDAA
ncbi:bifunctional DNA primase/polymerase [Pseudonocardia bannensis]|uniref:Bifunctional DNA primase/polymerase n=1 Tax=Pseudonocardia bannensis TaxID=630973 RepID=A0A848DD99_9PSEU|nr:bifunctional DNA primase/polymerase [Pseudonocardia bannensis]NMH90542.1 bifunctional DNA primase/polymerase [Pseudonocardia bannensis]